MVGAAWERVVFECSTPVLKPSLEAGASRFEQLELDRPARLLLRDSGSRSHPAAADELSDPDFHHVTASQLAVEQRTAGTLLRLERRLRADHFSGIPWPPLPACRVELRMSHLVLLLAGLAIERVRCSPREKRAMNEAGYGGRVGSRPAASDAQC
jgi:hypothetical protein